MYKGKILINAKWFINVTVLITETKIGETKPSSDLFEKR
jgi:hypothetical protein